MLIKIIKQTLPPSYLTDFVSDTILWCPAGLKFGAAVILFISAALGTDHKQL